jgi:hypothetical protein
MQVGSRQDQAGAGRLRLSPRRGRRAPGDWIGHSTVLLQMGGVNLITDPVFSRRAFPADHRHAWRGTSATGGWATATGRSGAGSRWPWTGW